MQKSVDEVLERQRAESEVEEAEAHVTLGVPPFVPPTMIDPLGGRDMLRRVMRVGHRLDLRL